MRSRLWCFIFGVLLCGQVAWGADRVKLELVGECVVDGDFIGIALQEDHAYLLAQDRLVVIDISDPHDPMHTGSVEAPAGSLWWGTGGSGWARSADFAVADDVAYTFDGQGLQLINVQDPTQPTLGPQICVYGYGSGQVVAVGSQVIWFIYPHIGFWSGEYSIIDITDPEEPQELLWLIEGLGCVHSLAPDFPRLYVGGHSWFDNDGEGSGVRIYDISNLSKPVLLGQTEDVGSADEILPNGSYLYCSGGFGFGPYYFIVDVSDANRPIRVSSGSSGVHNALFERQGVYANLRVNGNVLWGSWRYQDGGPTVVCLSNISEPSRPSRLGEFSLECEALTIRDDMLYACGLGTGLRIYRITELPAITRQSVANGKLNLQWNEPARGMKLQRATSLENPDWQSWDGSESMTSAELPLWGGQEYFRLAFDAPANMVWIEPGTFMMGSPETEHNRMDYEGPQTEITLTEGFFIRKYEVTQGEYLAVMGENPSWFNGDRTGEGGNPDYGTDLNRPVERMGWENAVAYCEALTEQERAANRIPQGFAFSLPTEAQWEFACRAGTTTRFSYGDDPDYTQLGNYAWYSENSDNQTHPVGQKLPNQWGLFDMHGNVWEWCQDWFAVYPGGSAVDHIGNAENSIRVARGGGWWIPMDCRSAARLGYIPAVGDICGFRVVLAPTRP